MKNPNKGIFFLRAMPHEYNPELYNEKDIFGSGSYSDEIIPYYNININIDNIYFGEKIRKTDRNRLILIPINGLIIASQDYEKKSKYFFLIILFHKIKSLKNIEYKSVKIVLECLYVIIKMR